MGNVSEVVAHLGRRALIRTCLNQSFKALRVVLDFRVDRCFEAFKAESGWVEGVCVDSVGARFSGSDVAF